MSGQAIKRKRTEEPEVRRAQILAAARTCFCGAGFHPTKMADIATAAGLSVGTIYQFFPSKDSLIEGLILDDLERQRLWLDQQPRDRPLDIYAFCTALADPGSGGFNLQLEIATELGRNDALRQVINARQREMTNLLLERIRSFLPGGGAPDLEERMRLVVALHVGTRAQLALEGAQGQEAFVALSDSICRELSQQLASGQRASMHAKPD